MPNADDMKGRAKEAAGSLTDDDDLKREGKADRATGKVKDVVDSVGDKVKGVLHKDRPTAGRPRRQGPPRGRPCRRSVPDRGHGPAASRPTSSWSRRWRPCAAPAWPRSDRVAPCRGRRVSGRGR